MYLKYDKDRRTIVEPGNSNDPSNWGRPYLERRYRILLIAAKRAESALGHACNPPPDDDADTRESDIALFGSALDQLRAALAPTD
jgi:hypothetical protein